MRPRLATCCRSAKHDCGVPELVGEARCDAIEVTLDPRAIEPSVLAASRMAITSGSRLPLRHHFPLGEFEISALGGEGDDALAAMQAAVRSVAGVGDDYLTVHAALHEEDAGTIRLAQTVKRLHELATLGMEVGVTVAFENLRWGLTCRPGDFLGIVDRSGVAITLDIGHAISSEYRAPGYSAAGFIRECGDRIRGAHVYERETDHHHAPKDLQLMREPLDALCDVGCPWWTIELTDPTEVRSTGRMLAEYLDARFSYRAIQA